MFRIDSEGATLDHKFTEGDPSLGVPATVVSADWLNSTQEEIAGFIEYFGITLNKLSTTQLQTALLEFFLRGGRQSPVLQILANNQASAADVAGFTFDSTIVKARICFYDIERKTDTLNKQESGLLFVTRDTADSQWRISKLSLHDDDVGVTLSTALVSGTVSKLQYVTDNLTGTSYDGKLRITSIIDIRF
jgi:hypothetical protein